ncbi:unnamed protein product, partial [Mesorhabditis spiculigera]
MGLTKQYLRYAHVGSFNAVGSSNGAVVAVDHQTCAVTACENVHFYNFRTGEKVASLSESEKQVTCLRLSHNKQFLAIGYADGAIRLFNRQAEDQNECIVFMGHKKGVNCLAFSHDGLTLASGGKDSSIVLWDIVAETGLFRLNGHKESITHVEFTLDDKRLVSACKDTFVKFWDVASQSCFYTLTESRSEIYSFLLLKEDTMLIVATSELELYIFDMTWLSGEEGHLPPGDDGPDSKRPKETQKHLDGPQLLGDCENKFVRVSLRGKVLRQCKGRALQLAASPDGQLVAALGSDRLIDFYRVYTDDEARKRLSKKLRKAKRKAADSGADEGPSSEDVGKDVTLVFARVGEWRAAAKPKWISFAPSQPAQHDDGVLQYRAFCLFVNNSVESLDIKLNAATNEVVVEKAADLEKMGHRGDVRSMSVASHDSLLATGGGNQVMLWNVETFRAANCLQEEGMDDVTAVLFATGDRHIIAATKTGQLFLFEVSTCECLEKRDAHEGPIWALVRLPDNTGFVTASADKKLKFWGYDLVSEGTQKRLTMREKRVLELQDEALCAAITPDGKFLIVGLLDMTATVFFVDTLKFYLSLYGHSMPVTCCTTSPDNKLVVTGSADKTIKIWGLDFGDCHKSFHAHDEAVSAVLFSPSDEMLVWSAGRDGKIRQWDAVKFEAVQKLDRHTAEMRALAQTSNGNMLLTASHDRSIRGWELTEEIVVLQEEEEVEREKLYEEKLADDEDVVAGETKDSEATVAERKSEHTIIATESIIEAIDIVRKERQVDKDDLEHTPHPLYLAYRSASVDHFVLDVIGKIRASYVDRCLLLLPLSYLGDILQAMAGCVANKYKVELASRIALFLIKMHHCHVTNSVEMVPIVGLLRANLPKGIRQIKDTASFNFAALRLLANEIENSQEIRVFSDLSKIEKKQNKKKKQQQEQGTNNKKAVLHTLAA